MSNPIDSNSSTHFALIPVISEYETTIDSLTQEILFYAKHQESLRKEILVLIHENKLLAQSVNQLLDWQTNHHCEVQDSKVIENELVENLKTQVCLAQKEKDSAIELWQAALQNLDHLETTLDLYEGRTHGYFSKHQVSKMKINYENKIEQLVKQVEQYKNDLDCFKKSLASKNIEIVKAAETETITHTLAKHLEDDVQLLDKKLKDIMKMRDELQLNLEIKNQIIANLQTKDIEAKRKVSEALQVVEAACFEKDAALARENEAKQEVVKISKALTEIIDETTEKVKTDTENIKQVYNAKVKNVQDSMQDLQKELNSKDTELARCSLECKRLNEELDRIRRGNTYTEESQISKLLILEKNLESTFQKLLLSEKKNIQLEADKESLKSDLEQIADCYKTDIKTRETEKEILKRQLKTLKVQLRASNTNVGQAVNKADKLKAQIKHLDAVVKEKLKSQQIMHEQALSKSIEGIKISNTQIQHELQRHVQLQRCLNKKIKKEMVEIINELEKRMEELKDAKKSVEKNLKIVIKDNLYFKEHLKHFCTKVISLVDVNETCIKPEEKINHFS